MQMAPFRFGPTALTTTTTTNILNPGTTTGGVLNGATFTSGSYTNLKIILTHLRVVNKTTQAATVSLWLGLTGANTSGTEFAWQGYSVPADSYVDWYGRVPLATTDYLVGGAGTATALTISGEGEVGIAF